MAKQQTQRARRTERRAIGSIASRPAPSRASARGRTPPTERRKGSPEKPKEWPEKPKGSPERLRGPKSPPAQPAKPARIEKAKPSKPVLPKPESVETSASAPAMVEAPEAEAISPTKGSRFPIVGIGASAGGLEALESFLRHVPKESGMAFVVIQHLDPTHKGILVELLQRACAMPVVQAKDRMTVEPDHVYVIPPNRDLSVLHSVLHLLPQALPRGLNLPIDFFFRSLAEDQQERSIGVILSGMGSDGTLGLRAIKEKAGAAFVQSLTSAKFDGMPRSAIEAGLADVVAPVEELPSRIVAYRQHAPHIARPGTPIEEKAQGALERVFVLLRAQTGNDFSLYKRSTIYRRLERRMGLHQIDSMAHYVRYLRENPREIELLFQELLIGVTSFFRDPAAWEYLKKEVMPALIAARPAGGTLRAWVPGCSTGEEAYSLAMVFKEALDPVKPVRNVQLQIFATDLDRDAIEKARTGVYPDNIVADVSPERLRRFFVQEDRGYRVGKEIREMVVFAPQNIAMDPPFTKLDLLSCRNLLIYLSSELQKKLIPLFHYSLASGGMLFLGTAETVGSFNNLFGQLDGKARIYRRLEQPMTAVPFEFPAAMNPPAGGEAAEPEPAAPSKPPPNIQVLTDRLLAQCFAPVGVLCNDKGDLLYSSGRTGKYLEPAVGKANLNLFAMAREGIRYELNHAFLAAVREERTMTLRGIKVTTNGDAQTVDITVQKLREPRELAGTVLVVIADAPAAARASTTPRRRSHEPRLSELEQELQRAREEVQTTREEMQTSQEELKSTNEELQSTNEELQSTNEELTTSKEEMQSLNEELQTVNQELQAKVDELSRSNNDMKNLLNSTEIATLFLDEELRVRRFTTPTAKLIKLIPGDAGRPITDIATDLDYFDLADDAREVLHTLIFKEKQVSTRDGRYYSVRIMPYRTLENVIDGVVITFTDASTSRGLENALRQQASDFRQMAESLPNLIWGARPDGTWDYVSRTWGAYAGMLESELLGWNWLELIHADERVQVRDAWQQAVQGVAPFDAEFRLRNARGEYRWFKARAVPIRDASGRVVKWYGSNTDVDDLERAEEKQSRGVTKLDMLIDSLREGYLELDSNLVVTRVNKAAERWFMAAGHQVTGRGLLEALPDLRDGEFEQKLRLVLRGKSPTSILTRGKVFADGRPYRWTLVPQDGSPGIVVLLSPGDEMERESSAE